MYATIVPGASGPFRIAVLTHDMEPEGIRRHYLDPHGIDPEQVLLVRIHRDPSGKKTPAKEIRRWFEEQLAADLAGYGVEALLVSCGETFKTVCKLQKVEAWLGYALGTDLGPWKVAYVPNHRVIWRDPPSMGAKVAQGVGAIRSWMMQDYREPGQGLLGQCLFPRTKEEIVQALLGIIDEPELTCDIEAFSLKAFQAGIGTIGFAVSKERGVCFPVDYRPIPGAVTAPYGEFVPDPEVREIVLRFLSAYRGTLTFHNAGYDLGVLIATLWMRGIGDNVGLLEGLECLTGSFEDTKIVSYLATNSCARTDNSLKAQAREFAGNYAQDEIKDIRRIPLKDLLEYNQVDCLSTWFVKEKRWPEMVRDEQDGIYRDLFKPALVDIVQEQLTGMPVVPERVAEVRWLLEAIWDDATHRIQSNPLIRRYVDLRIDAFVLEKNQGYKDILLKDGTVKRKVLHREELSGTQLEALAFNPGSGPQMQELLFGMVGLPVLGKTKTGQPETGAETLKALREHTDDREVLDLLYALEELKGIQNTLHTFVPALEGALEGPDGHHYLFGYFNLGGTVSGRLSSSDPNLQNIPANAEIALSQALLDRLGEAIAPFLDKGRLHLGKLIKSCFSAPPGWLFCGIDFDSLEDRISALTTKDPNKLRVYTDGFDGHCLRAHAYFGESMPGVELAPPGATCYKANVGGTDIYFHAEEVVEYLGQSMRGSELHALLARQGL